MKNYIVTQETKDDLGSVAAALEGLMRLVACIPEIRGADSLIASVVFKLESITSKMEAVR